MARNLAKLVSLPLIFFAFGAGPSRAGQTYEEAGVIVCVTDKWDEKEPEKGHKIADYTGRCVTVPSDAALEKVWCDVVGKYEYMPDGSWKGSGTGVDHYKSGDTRTFTWDEGSHLKEYTFSYTGGTGKYKSAGGGGSYVSENLNDALTGGTYKTKLELP